MNFNRSLLYVDARGKYAPWKLPRKLKKKYRAAVMEAVDSGRLFVNQGFRVSVWWGRGIGWTFRIRKKRKAVVQG